MGVIINEWVWETTVLGPEEQLRAVENSYLWLISSISMVIFFFLLKNYQLAGFCPVNEKDKGLKGAWSEIDPYV